MGIQSTFFDIDAVPARVFSSTKTIASKSHVAVFIKATPLGEYEIVNQTDWELINNSVVFADNPVGYGLEVRVADAPDELETSPSDISIVASIADDVTAVVAIASDVSKVAAIDSDVSKVAAVDSDIAIIAPNINSVNTVSGQISKVVTVSDNILSVVEVYSNIEDVNEVATNMEYVQNAYPYAQTSASYAVQTEDVFVYDYVNDIPTTDYSAYHWAKKAEAWAATINAPTIGVDDVGKFPVVNATYDGYDLSNITESEIVTKTDNQALHDTDAIEFRESGTVSYIDLNKGDGSTETIGFTRQYALTTGTIAGSQTLQLTAPSGYSFCDLSSQTDDDSGQEAGISVVGIDSDGTSVSIECSPTTHDGEYSIVWSKFISA